MLGIKEMNLKHLHLRNLELILKEKSVQNVKHLSEQTKNLIFHLKSFHNLKKCKKCRDQNNLMKHEKSAHEDYLLKCKHCDYTTDDLSHLTKHINGKHIEKNIKCGHCDQ